MRLILPNEQLFSKLAVMYLPTNTIESKADLKNLLDTLFAKDVSCFSSKAKKDNPEHARTAERFNQVLNDSKLLKRLNNSFRGQPGGGVIKTLTNKENSLMTKLFKEKTLESMEIAFIQLLVCRSARHLVTLLGATVTITYLPELGLVVTPLSAESITTENSMGFSISEISVF